MGWVVGGDFCSFVYELADDWYGFGFSHVAGVACIITSRMGRKIGNVISLSIEYYWNFL